MMNYSEYFQKTTNFAKQQKNERSNFHRLANIYLSYTTKQIAKKSSVGVIKAFVKAKPKRETAEEEFTEKMKF